MNFLYTLALFVVTSGVSPEDFYANEVNEERVSYLERMEMFDFLLQGGGIDGALASNLLDQK